MIKNLHRAYDKMEEPRRFLTAIIVGGLPIIGMSAGNYYVMLASWIVLFALIITRMGYIHKWY